MVAGTRADRSRWLAPYAWTVSAAGLGASALLIAVGTSIPSAITHAEFWVFTGFVVLGELAPIRVPGRVGELAISTTFTFALMLTVGLAPALAVQVAASVLADVVVRKPWRRVLFNAGQYSLSWAAAAAALVLAGGTIGPASTDVSPAQLFAILCAGAAFFVVNATLARTAVALDRGIGVRIHLRTDIGFRLWTTVMLVGLAPAVAAVARTDLLVVPLIVLPLAAIHRAERESMRNQHLAYHDPLTGLPNRVLFRDRVEQALLGAARGGWSVAVMVMDLDRFKEINDTLGHQQGDVLLREIGPRLAQELRASDTVARLGGDEFAVLLPHVDSDPVAVEQVAERLLAALHEPFQIEDVRLAVGASLGVAMHPDHAADVETLMQRADVAMYRAKESRTGHEFYSAGDDTNTVDRLAMVAELRSGIERGELILHYQPKVQLPTADIAGVEALVRWRHPVRGLLSPAEFIPLAEHAGLMGLLTTRVLDDALRQCREWLDGGVDVRVAVNISARSLLDGGLPDQIGELLLAHDLDAHHLALEITESVIMADPTRAAEILRRISDMGVRVSIDDFGTGYSSLSYLRRLDVDEIKIDRSFVTGMAKDDHERQLVHSIIELGHNLGLEVVAEGVEDEETVFELERLGCDHAQGFFLGRPLAPGILKSWMRARDQFVAHAAAGAATQ